MPRFKRVKSKTKIYHVMIRGNEKRAIFMDQQDRHKFIRVLFKQKDKHQFVLYSFCLMDNHVHLVIKEGDVDIGVVMQAINVSYVSYFNKKYDRVGHLFQGRFKSEPIESERYLLGAVRYVHNNPVKEGMVVHPEDYMWSSYNEYIGQDVFLTDIAFVLSLFSKDINKAVCSFIEFSKKDHKDIYLDNDDSYTRDERAKQFAYNFCRRHRLHINDLKLYEMRLLRNELVKYLSNNYRISNVKIGSILGIDRKTVGAIINNNVEINSNKRI